MVPCSLTVVFVFPSHTLVECLWNAALIHSLCNAALVSLWPVQCCTCSTSLQCCTPPTQYCTLTPILPCNAAFIQPLCTKLYPFYQPPMHMQPPTSTPSTNPAVPATRNPTGTSRAISGQKRALSPFADAGTNLKKKPRSFLDPNLPLPCCAICLGRHPHLVIECSSPRTWNDLFDTFAQRIKKNIWSKDGRQLCTAWQRPDGCPTPKHNHLHLCSGCGSPDHGAHCCTRAQKV